MLDTSNTASSSLELPSAVFTPVSYAAVLVQRELGCPALMMLDAINMITDTRLLMRGVLWVV